MRLLFLLLIAGAAAYFTNSTRAAHEQAARAFLEDYTPSETEAGVSLDSIVDYVKGMMSGEGRYESYYVISKYSVDLPGASYLECYGAFTIVRCSDAASG